MAWGDGQTAVTLLYVYWIQARTRLSISVLDSACFFAASIRCSYWLWNSCPRCSVRRSLTDGHFVRRESHSLQFATAAPPECFAEQHIQVSNEETHARTAKDPTGCCIASPSAVRGESKTLIAQSTRCDGCGPSRNHQAV
jgi:hypothetical protein